MTTYDSRAKWRVIADSLRTQISQGDYRPGDQVPSEAQLARTWHVARGTARIALLALEDSGTLTPGRPRRVARNDPVTVHVSRSADLTHPGESPTQGADAWVKDMQDAGREPTQQIGVGTQVAGTDVAQRLGIIVGEIVTYRRLVREAGGEPHNLITFWFPQDVADGTLLARPASITEGSVAWLEKMYGLLDHELESVTARMPGPDEAELLRIPPGVPVLVVWRISKSPSRPLVTSMAVYPADRTKLRLML